MNKISNSNLVIILFSFLFLSACKKGDYRDNYIGSFNFHYSKTEFITDTTYTDTTENYPGEIVYGSEKNLISIHYLPNSNFETILNKDGSFSEPINQGLGNASGGGFKTKDSLSFGSATGTGGSETVIIQVTGKRRQ